MNASTNTKRDQDNAWGPNATFAKYPIPGWPSWGGLAYRGPVRIAPAEHGSSLPDKVKLAIRLGLPVTYIPAYEIDPDDLLSSAPVSVSAEDEPLSLVDVLREGLTGGPYVLIVDESLEG